ncbi:hypothetical protein [uncultured Bartonella sp.]|uniref:hypothetical protein n=1 Tax=uncultured Bartonella sp. TaxID=104108 RepID=UPI0025D7FB29|nr:hypothetical protein [uncultured Bartonella sp.]
MIAEIITSSVPFLAAEILATFHSAVCRFIRLPLFGCLYSATLSDDRLLRDKVQVEPQSLHRDL